MDPRGQDCLDQICVETLCKLLIVEQDKLCVCCGTYWQPPYLRILSFTSSPSLFHTNTRAGLFPPSSRDLSVEIFDSDISQESSTTHIIHPTLASAYFSV